MTATRSATQQQVEIRSTPVIHRGWRRLVAALLILHGVAHLVGTTHSVSALDGGSIQYLAGSWQITSNAMLIGWAVTWTVAAIGFAVGAVVVWADVGGWPTLLASVAGASLVLCIIGLPQTAIGVAVNVLLIAGTLRIRATPGKATP